MIFQEIIDTREFQIFISGLTGVDFPNDVHQRQDTRIYYALHKAREAINKKSYLEGGVRIIINEYCVQVSEMHIGAVETANIYFFKDYNDQEIEALAAALDFINKENKK